MQAFKWKLLRWARLLRTTHARWFPLGDASARHFEVAQLLCHELTGFSGKMKSFESKVRSHVGEMRCCAVTVAGDASVVALSQKFEDPQKNKARQGVYCSLASTESFNATL